MGRVAEWSALLTGMRGASGSIPAQVITFFGGFINLEQYFVCRFELNFNLRLKLIFLHQIKLTEAL